MQVLPIKHPISFTSSDKPTHEAKKYCQKQFIKYGALGTIGCIAGYSIPLKKIDGPDVVSHVNGGNRLVMMKTKVPNEIGKYKNAGIGIVVGIALAKIYDLIFNR